MSEMERHTTRVPGWPDPGSQNVSLTLALRMVRYYGDRVPSAKELMHDFDVHRATAYRWRAAFVESMEQVT